jgi:hypothetical protein
MIDPMDKEDQSGCLVTKQSERRQVLQDDRATFRSFADAFANEARGGRFAKSDHASMVKPLPPTSPWAGPNPGPGDEPPLGYDINEVPDLGFPQSGPAPGASAVEPTDDRGGASPGPDSPASTLSSEK